MPADLIKHLPSWLQEFKEIQTLTDTENQLFDVLSAVTAGTMDDQFILTASEKAITEYEKYYKVIPYLNEKLESRKAVIIARKQVQKIFTLNALRQYIANLDGIVSSEISVDYENFHIDIFIKSTNSNSIKSLQITLAQRLPANMTYTLKNELAASAQAQINMAGLLIY